MLLGQLVAISVASSLFFLALSSAPLAPKQLHHRAPLVLWLPVVVSLLTTVLVPYTSPTTFLPNLLVMHALLIVPLLPLPERGLSSQALSIPVRKLHAISTLLCLSLRLISFRRTFLSPLPASRTISALISTVSARFPLVVSTLHAHPAQSSIGYDILWSCATFGAWTIFEGERSTWDTAIATAGGPLSGFFVADALSVLMKREGRGADTIAVEAGKAKTKEGKKDN
jgi:hypothetical protein